MAAAVAVAALWATPSSAPARAAAAAAGEKSNWLGEINVYRQAAGLSPVTAQPEWELGLEHHLTYLIETPRGLISGLYASLHTENPLSPYYTPDGAREGQSSDLELGGIQTPLQAIQRWLVAPFHAIGMLRPQLTQVGLALSHGYAALDVINGLDPALPRPDRPVRFPGPGMTTNLTAFGGEYPNPLETCGWQGPAGLPVILLLPRAPSAGLRATLSTRRGRQSSARGGLCVVDEQTYRTSDAVYGPTGAQILARDHAVLLIPRRPLVAGRYTMAVWQAGERTIRWSFAVNPHARSARAPGG